MSKQPLSRQAQRIIAAGGRQIDQLQHQLEDGQIDMDEYLRRLNRISGHADSPDAARGSDGSDRPDYHTGLH